MSRHRTPLLALSVAVLTVCSDGSGPPSIVGEHVLTTINDEPLPATAPGPSPTFSRHVSAGELVLNADGTFERTYVFTLLSEPEGEPITSSDEGTYVVEDGSLVIDPYGDAAPRGGPVTEEAIEIVDFYGNVFAFAR